MQLRRVNPATHRNGAGAVPLAGATTGDEMILDLDGVDVDGYWNGWEHAACPNTDETADGVLQN